MKILNMVIPLPLKLKRCKLHKAAHHLAYCGLINDVKLFTTACRNFFTEYKQTSHVTKAIALELALLAYWNFSFSFLRLNLKVINLFS